MDRPSKTLMHAELLFLAKAVLATVLLNPPGGVHQLLLARVKRMTLRADFNFQDIARNRRTRLEAVPACAPDFDEMIPGVNVWFHYVFSEFPSDQYTNYFPLRQGDLSPWRLHPLLGH